MPAPLFSKRHYEWLARFMVKQRPDRFPQAMIEWDIMQRELGLALARENLRFDVGKFLTACNKGRST